MPRPVPCFYSARLMSLIPSSLQMAALLAGASFLPSTQTAALTLVRPRPSDARCARLSASETDYYFPIHRGKVWILIPPSTTALSRHSPSWSSVGGGVPKRGCFESGRQPGVGRIPIGVAMSWFRAGDECKAADSAGPGVMGYLPESAFRG